MATVAKGYDLGYAWRAVGPGANGWAWWQASQ
jgi:hypothetical protein